MGAVLPGVKLSQGQRFLDIDDWRPEDAAFWESQGKRIAYRNLWISVPALLCGFAVWGMWASSPCRCSTSGSSSPRPSLFTLTAIAGISGATMRIPASFLIRLASGRNTIFLTTAMLLSPAMGPVSCCSIPVAVVDIPADGPVVRRGRRQFASSMSNISTFFPKSCREPRWALTPAWATSA